MIWTMKTTIQFEQHSKWVRLMVWTNRKCGTYSVLNLEVNPSSWTDVVIHSINALTHTLCRYLIIFIQYRNKKIKCLNNVNVVMNYRNSIECTHSCRVRHLQLSLFSFFLSLCSYVRMIHCGNLFLTQYQHSYVIDTTLSGLLYCVFVWLEN